MTIKTKALADSSCDCTIFHKIVANTVLNGDERNCVKILSNDQDLPGIKPLNVPVQFVTIETKALVDSGCDCTIFHKIVANTVLNGDERNCVKILSNDQDLPGIKPLNVPVQFVTIETKALVDSGCACSILHQKVAYTVLNGDERNCVKILSNDQDLPGIEPLNVPVQFVTIETKALVDSGCACTIIYQNVANAVLNGDERSNWIKTPKKHDLEAFSNETVKIVGVIFTTRAAIGKLKMLTYNVNQVNFLSK